MQPSPTLGGDRGTKAAEYLVDDFSDRLKGLQPSAVRARKHEDVRLMNASSHAGKPSVGAQVECALSQSRECQ